MSATYRRPVAAWFERIFEVWKMKYERASGPAIPQTIRNRKNRPSRSSDVSASQPAAFGGFAATTARKPARATQAAA